MKPKVTLNCVADRYAAPNERIIEFSSYVGGGLISFFVTEDGRLFVDVYNHDSTVEVRVGGVKTAWVDRLIEDMRNLPEGSEDASTADSGSNSAAL